MVWIRHYDKVIGAYDPHHECSNCGHECFYKMESYFSNIYQEDILTPYCPWCGEKKEGVVEE